MTASGVPMSLLRGEKMLRTSISKLAIASVVLALWLPGAASAQTAFSQIVVFGTSLSDSGNVYTLTGEQITAPYATHLDELLIPDRPYARGGHHFSNGATWIEQFAQTSGLAGSTRPAILATTQEAANFALGGARARDLAAPAQMPCSAGAPNDLQTQVDCFLLHFGQAPQDALYVVEMGSNDVRDAVDAFASGNPATAAAILGNAIQAIGGNIGKLFAFGARRFLIVNVPDLGKTPALRATDLTHPGAAALASGVALQFNGLLQSLLPQLQQLPGSQFRMLDSFGLLNTVVAQPAAYGFSNVTTSCVLGPTVPPFTCQTAEQFLFWDGIHPTQAFHSIVADAARSVLGL